MHRPPPRGRWLLFALEWLALALLLGALIATMPAPAEDPVHPCPRRAPASASAAATAPAGHCLPTETDPS